LQPHEHWHVDVSYLNIAGTFYFHCSILDGCSRFLCHWEIRDKMEETDVQTILHRAREIYPDARPRIITDDGPQFIAKDFKESIRIAGMTHVKTSPYYPQSNGKIERWHKTLKDDCIQPKVSLSLDEARRLVGDFVLHYNTVRMNSAIGYVAPKDRMDGWHKEIHEARDRKLAVARNGRKQARQVQHEQHQTTSRLPTRPVIDFAAVRAAIILSVVLDLLGFRPNGHRGAQQRGPCPLHGSTPGTTRCFSANLEQQTFKCFKRGCPGNALDLWAKATKQTVYDAALELCHRLGISLPTLPVAFRRNRVEELVASSAGNTTIDPTGILNSYHIVANSFRPIFQFRLNQDI
jgi:Integrase core domain/CHC2 zinc finger